VFPEAAIDQSDRCLAAAASGLEGETFAGYLGQKSGHHIVIVIFFSISIFTSIPFSFVSLRPLSLSSTWSLSSITKWSTLNISSRKKRNKKKRHKKKRNKKKRNKKKRNKKKRKEKKWKGENRRYNQARKKCRPGVLSATVRKTRNLKARKWSKDNKETTRQQHRRDARANEKTELADMALYWKRYLFIPVSIDGWEVYLTTECHTKWLDADRRVE
jgi:hypothetical protein